MACEGVCGGADGPATPPDTQGEPHRPTGEEGLRLGRGPEGCRAVAGPVYNVGVPATPPGITGMPALWPGAGARPGVLSGGGSLDETIEGLGEVKLSIPTEALFDLAD